MSIRTHIMEETSQAGKTTEAWFALQVKGQYENIVSAHLDGKGYKWFLPLCKIRKRFSDRWKEIQRPLFPGYIFCQLNPFNRLPILEIPGVSRIVGTSKSPVAIDETEIAAIRATVNSGLPSQPCPFLQIGRRVRIDYGPLSGLEGILAYFKGEHRLILSVSLLQRSVAVEVDVASVTSLSQQSWDGNAAASRVA